MARDSDQWFSCEVCEKVFVSVGAKNKHYKIHLEKKEICKICGKGFNDVSNRNAHEKNVHNELDFLECSECGKKFKYKRSLTDHIKRIHSSHPAVIPSDAHDRADLSSLSGVDVEMYPQVERMVTEAAGDGPSFALADEIFPEVDGDQEEQQAGMMEIRSEATATDPVTTLSSIGTGDTDTSGDRDPECDIATNTAASSVLHHTALKKGQDAADPGTPGHVHFSDRGLDPAMNPLVTGTLLTDPDTEPPGTSHNTGQDGADISGDGGLDQATDRAALSSIAMINAAEIDLARSGLQLNSDGGEKLSKVSVTIGDKVVTYFDYSDSNQGSFIQHMMDFESSNNNNNNTDEEGSKEHDDIIPPAAGEEADCADDELLDQRSQGSNENSEIVVVGGREDGNVEQNGSNKNDKVNNYECTVCGKKFARKQYYRIHHQAHFLGAKYNCPKCDKKFEHKKHLIYHLKYLHPEDSGVLLKCNDCGKKFKHPQSLKEHMFRHELGEKTYSAEEKKEALELVEQIGKAKAAKRLGISYRTLAYWESRKQKIVCRFCGKELSSNRRLKEHEKSMHNQHNEN